MSKMLSREVRTYWKDKVSSKFSDRESAIETEDHNRINEMATAKYPAFEKSLGITQLVKAFRDAETDLDKFLESKDRVEAEKQNKLDAVREKFIKELEKWKSMRGWEDDLPRHDKDDRVGLKKYISYLEDVCFEEAKKHFYKSKEGQKMQAVKLQKEKAMDILHTDGHKEELLIALAKVCEAVKIPMNIPHEALKITSK
jgi:hypothetical protein|tara:strand:- start:660 stop:1256 length:597 start_codon:yes stop_codon:yes gene_type:complete